MKGNIKSKAIAGILALIMTASPVWGIAFAADEASEEAAAPSVAAEEAKAPAENNKIAYEIKETAPAMEAEKAEAPAEKAKEMAVEAVPAEAAEKAEKEEAAPAAEEQAAQAEEDLPVVVLDQPASDKLNIHITGILWSAKKKENGHAVPFESTFTMTNGQTKAKKGYTSYVGGASVGKQTTADGKYTFLNEFVLVKAGSGIVTAGSASEVKAISKIGFKNGTATITFADGSTKQFVNASDIYIAPVYSVEYSKTLSVRYIDNISTASGSWSGGIDGYYKHTMKQPDAQKHYEFISWENSETAETYDPGDVFTVLSADLKEKNTEISIYAKWQPSVTVRYHFNGNVVEKESFKSINVYDQAAEIDGVEYNAWYAEDGSLLAEDTAYDAPEATTVKVERTVYDVYARRPVTITAASATWTFDGKAHSDDEVSVTAGGLFDGDEIVAEVSGSITNVGEAANTIDSVKIMRDGSDVSEYYDITTEDGDLVIEAAPAAPVKNNDKPAGTTVKNTDPAEPAVIENAPVPMAAPATIEDSETPLAASEPEWALLNLIMTIVTGLISAVLLAGWFGKKDEEGEEEDSTRRKGFARLASILPAAGAIIAFIITENINNTMALVDRWTILMAVILLIQGAVALLARKENKEEANGKAVETVNA